MFSKYMLCGHTCTFSFQLPLVPVQFTADQFLQRTRATHEQQSQSIETAASSSVKAHLTTTYGIHRNSILNSLRYYHVADGLPPDIMHDILEGALPYEAKLLLLHFISNRYFTLGELNQRIKSFPYGTENSSSKPSLISAATMCSSDNSLKQSGTNVHKQI